MQNGASRSHYECLQNSTRLVTRLGEKRVMLGAGTTRNEQLHRELKSWGRNIMMAHVDRLNNGISLFVMAKLLTHSSASYLDVGQPEVVQRGSPWYEKNCFSCLWGQILTM